MKKLPLGLIALFFSVSLVAQSNLNDTGKTNIDLGRRVVFINPVAFFVAGFEGGYASALPNGKDLRVLMGYYVGQSQALYSETEIGNLITKYKNFEAFKFEAHYYFLKSVDKFSSYDMAIYFGPFATIKTAAIDVEKENRQSNVVVFTNHRARATAISGGILGTIRLTLSKGIFVEAHGGGGVTIPIGGSYIEDIHVPILFPLQKSINPKFGINFGISLDNFK